MKIELTPDQQAFVRDAVASGRLGSEDDAIREALALWERRERARAEILADLAAAEAALACAEGRTITEESMCKLAAEVKQRGRARLAATQAAKT
jgi:putative addiction module CopG family antidote